jgi:hypothetical protein
VSVRVSLDINILIESFISLCIIEMVRAIFREYKPWIVLQVITMLKQDTMCPNFSQKNAVLQSYLTQHNIPFSATDIKKVLYEKKDPSSL